jgi:hypothetical protein
MRHLLAAAAVALGMTLSTEAAQAQEITSVPIDTNSLVVRPADTATNIFGRTSQYLSRSVANVIDDNGFVRTINRLLGRTVSVNNRQPNGLPSPTLYPSTRYRNSFQPAMPTSMQYGTTPVFK